MDKIQKNLLGMVGICRGAGSLIVGVPMICEELRRRGEGYPHIIVLEACDTSENTHKKLTDKCSFYKAKHIRLTCDCETLGGAVGKSAVAAVAVMGENFCRAIDMKLQDGSN